MADILYDIYHIVYSYIFVLHIIYTYIIVLLKALEARREDLGHCFFPYRNVIPHLK